MLYNKESLLTRDILRLRLSPSIRVKLAAAGFNTLDELLHIQLPQWRLHVPGLNKEDVQEIIDFVFRKKLDYILDKVNSGR